MLTTLELRWFSHGIPPTEVERWFSADCPGELQGPLEEREDLYLYTPGCDYLNIKLRQGSLEVKWRKAEIGIQRFGSQWEGKLETWLKWSCEDPTQQSIVPADIVSQGPWVVVHKQRCRRSFSLRTSTLTSENPFEKREQLPQGGNFPLQGTENVERPSQRPHQSISCELTQLNVRNDVWWSVAFEMAADEANQINNFESLVSQISKTYQGPELLAKNSYAYPRWLSLLT